LPGTKFDSHATAARVVGYGTFKGAVRVWNHLTKPVKVTAYWNAATSPTVMKLQTSKSEPIDELNVPEDDIDITTEKPQEYALERNTKPIEDIKSKKPGMPITDPQIIITLEINDRKHSEKVIENPR
jgi:hypothetical protein